LLGRDSIRLIVDVGVCPHRLFGAMQQLTRTRAHLGFQKMVFAINGAIIDVRNAQPLSFYGCSCTPPTLLPLSTLPPYAYFHPRTGRNGSTSRPSIVSSPPPTPRRKPLRTETLHRNTRGVVAAAGCAADLPPEIKQWEPWMERDKREHRVRHRDATAARCSGSCFTLVRLHDV